MLSVDTNVLVRFLTGDDPDQLRRAEALFRESDIRIGATVLLETAWVLRKVYEYRKEEVVVAVRSLLALPRVSAEDDSSIRLALEWIDEGMNFADALHLALTAGHAFVTFDRSFLATARRLRLSVREP